MTRRFGILFAVACALFAQLQKPPDAAATAGKGSIEGTVINDLTREPVRKAEVVLAGRALVRAITDQTGRFVFRSLPPGAFTIMAQRPGFGAPHGFGPALTQVTLAADEKKTGVEITLVPRAAISGRIADEFGSSVADCGVNAMKPQYLQGRPKLANSGLATTDDKGEYRIHDLAPGRYYVQVRCVAELPVAHALMRRDDPNKPHQIYPPLFYPGVPEPGAATRVAVLPGAEVRGIDIQVRRADTVTVRGRIAVDADNVQIMLFPQRSALVDALALGGRLDRATGTFQIRSVLPGSYLLVANTTGDGPGLQARMPIEIDNTPPEPVDVTLSPGADVSGVIEIEGGRSGIPEQAQVSLNPIDVDGIWYSPHATAGKDGAFTLHGVLPGRWSLNVLNVPGYVKLFTIGDQEVFPRSFDFAPGAAGPWRIVMGTRTGEIEATLTASVPPGGNVSAVLAPAASEQLGAGLERVFPANAEGRFQSAGIPPGRYQLFAVETANAWEYANRPDFLNAIESRTQMVEVREGEKVKATMDLIHADELERLLQELE